MLVDDVHRLGRRLVVADRERHLVVALGQLELHRPVAGPVHIGVVVEPEADVLHDPEAAERGGAVPITVTFLVATTAWSAGLTIGRPTSGVAPGEPAIAATSGTPGRPAKNPR